MILGRPTNLWLGFLTAATGFVGLLADALGIPISAAVLGGAVTLEGALVVLVAGSPPVLNRGDRYHVATPNGQPEIERTVPHGNARSDDTPR